MKSVDLLDARLPQPSIYEKKKHRFLWSEVKWGMAALVCYHPQAGKHIAEWEVEEALQAAQNK